MQHKENIIYGIEDLVVLINVTMQFVPAADDIILRDTGTRSTIRIINWRSSTGAGSTVLNVKICSRPIKSCR